MLVTKGQILEWEESLMDDCSLCDNAMPPPEVIPYSFNGEGAIVTGLIGTFSGGSRRNHEIFLSTLSALYCHFLLVYCSNKYKESNGLI